MNWQPSPYLYPPGVVIDYLPLFFFVVPGSAFVFFNSLESVLFIISAIILSILSVLTMEFVELVCTRKLKSYRSAFLIFIISVVWSFLPALPLLLHPYVKSVISLPFGPVAALFALPTIDNFRGPRPV